ncbi:hypothetical protein LTR84_006878 [Exophiala bonariae]|uniref:Uncharacterized protein n=1 Tax=Exophiala bonariae TaxID=1690606 RepID=A0AAV9N3I5_9EURO|nr:hypothetical protein LTR84_006878 [Exophiala bonariae]
MSPSRGPSTTATLPSASPKEHPHSGDDLAVQQQSNSALRNAKRNLNFFLSPASHGAPGERPARLRTRALLRTLRYVTQFIFWRLVRWAKYVAVGSLVAAVGATAFGGAITGVAWLAAPPTIGASIIAASLWGVGRHIARRAHKRWVKSGGDVGEEVRERVQDEGGVRTEGSYGVDMGPRAVPW